MAGLGPRVLQVLAFASARAPELQALHELSQHAPLSSPTDAKLEAQKNQRRRRANAFKSHQMPQRLRSTPKTPSKAANRCRKHERRAHKLVASRAAANCERPRWLSSHLWHAKRMKMVERFGFVLAARRADKNATAALQALRSKAVLHDASYYGVIELFGLPQVILEALQLVSDPSGSDFHGLRFLASKEEGTSMLYQEGQFPRGAIAPVTFMWRPLKADFGEGFEFELHEDWQNKKRQLWIWVHPAAYMEAATAIAAACQAVAGEEEAVEMLDRRGQLSRLKLRGKLAGELMEALAESGEGDEVMDEGDSDHEDGFDEKDTVDKCRDANRQNLLSALGNETEKDVVYAVAVKDPRLARWKDGKLCQPRARSETGFSLLHEPPANSVAKVGISVIESPLSGLSLSSLGKDAEEPESKLILTEMQALLAWTTGGSSTAVPGDEVAGATYPNKSAGGDQPELNKAENGSAVELETSPSSLLWSFSKRQKIESNFLKDNTLNDEIYRQRKEGMLVNSPEEQHVNSQPLHLLVIKKSEPYPHTSGWDIVCPPASVPSLLKAMAFGGALVVGLEEDAAVSTVLHQPSFPCDYPDTQAGQAYWEARAHDLETEQAKKPKSKRVNFKKLGVTSPFQPLWESLFDQQNPETDAEDEASQVPYVLRGEKYMEESFCFYRSKGKGIEDDEAMTSPGPDAASIVPAPMPTLVCVVVVVPRRGNIDVNAMLFAPSAEDQEKFRNDKNWKGYDIDLSKKGTAKKPKANEQSLIGYVTSAVYDRPKGAFRAVGFIACEPLQQLFLGSRGYSKQGHSALAMLRSPGGTMVRPVLVQVEMY